MIPPFPIEGGLPLALSRAFSVAGLMAAFGALLYQAVLAPAGLPEPVQFRLRRLGWLGIAFALAGAVLWLLVETIDLAGDVSPGSVWAVLLHTLFGHLVAARACLLLLSAAAFAYRKIGFAMLAAAASMALQAGHSHAFAMYGPGVLAFVSVLHLLAAGAWIGALLPLLIVVRGAPDLQARQAATAFSSFGIICVFVLVGTSASQFIVFVGDIPGLVGTAYGWVAGAKIGLLLLLVGLAARNKFSLTPRLPATRQGLVRAIAVEAAMGLAVVCAAGVLTELPPAMHVQKLWPFPFVPDLSAWREDADYRREATLALGAVAVAIAGFGIAGAVWWRGRRVAGASMAAVSFLIAGLALPHFAPLLVPAYPTMFFHSNTGFAADTITHGEAVFASNCVTCHGPAGRGDGPAAKALKVPPADLTAAHLWMHQDGELFWWIHHGIEGPEGGLAMPGFASLGDDDVWALIDYLHAHNAGLRVLDGAWPLPVQAPDFPIDCGPGGATSLAALKGRDVRLLVGSGGEGAPGFTTVVVSGAAHPGGGVCVAEAASALPALSIVSGQSQGAMALDGGTEILLDKSGRLREVGRPSRWHEPGSLEKAAAGLASMPPSLANDDMGMPPGMKM